MGIDVVALIRDSDHKVVFSTASDNIVKQISLSPNAVLQTVNVGEVTTGTVVSTFPARQDGVDYQLLVATNIDSSFLISVAEVHSLDLRLYLHTPKASLKYSPASVLKIDSPQYPMPSSKNCAIPSCPVSSSRTVIAACTGRSLMTRASCKA